VDDDAVGRALRALDQPSPPSPAFAAALERRLLAELGQDAPTNWRVGRAVRLGLTAAPNGRADVCAPFPPAFGQVRRWAPVGQVATAAVLVLTLLGGYVAFAMLQPVPRVEAPAAATDHELVVTLSSGALLTRLDPATLADVAGAIDPDIAAPGMGWIYAGDGSTRVAIEDVLDEDGDDRASIIVVQDARTGSERARFETRVPVGSPLLSNDGRRLVVKTDHGTVGVPYGWQVYDTERGRHLATTESDLSSGSVWAEWIDPAAARLYRLRVPYTLTMIDERRQTMLIIYDLATGTQIKRMELPSVHAGIWDPYDENGRWGNPDEREWTPGFAFTRDGRRLAIVHADEEAVTLIDGETLEIERTVALTRPTSALERALGWLSLAPQEAAAKVLPATAWQAAFAPDGRRLYAWGFETRQEVGEAASERPVTRALGLRVIDVESGGIAAEALPDALLNRVVPAPDGRSIYVVGPRAPDELGPYVLRRLDAETLAVLAEREFPGPIGLVVRTGATATTRPDAATPEGIAALLARCPGSAGTEIPGVTEFSSVGLGELPVWLAGWGNPPATPAAGATEPTVPGLNFQPGAPYLAPYGWGHRALWVIEPGFTEPVALRGASLDDGTPVWFNPGAPGDDPTRAPVLDPRRPGIPLQHGDWTTSPPALWAEFPSAMYFPRTGCYELVAEWEGGSWRAILPYVAPSAVTDP